MIGNTLKFTNLRLNQFIELYRDNRTSGHSIKELNKIVKSPTKFLCHAVAFVGVAARERPLKHYENFSLLPNRNVLFQAHIFASLYSSTWSES